MTRQFIYFKPDGTPIAKPVEFTKLMDAAENRLQTGQGPFTGTKEGDDAPFVTNKTREQTLKKFKVVVNKGDVGPTYRIRNSKGVTVFRCREIVAAIDLIDTNGNDKIDVIWTFEKDNFPNATFLGSYVCKVIAGTNTHSQHSYGNAVDTGGVNLEVLAKLLVKNADNLSLQNVIYHDQIWSRGVGWRHYSGIYHYHCHADCCPGVSSSRACGVVQTGKC